LGRDLLARVVAGARASLAIGVATTLLAGAVGTMLGVIAGGLGGRFDVSIGFVADVQLALPFVLVAVALAATLGVGARTVVLTLALTGWVTFARVARLQARSLRHAPFVEAAVAAGATRASVLRRHILPNLFTPIVVIATQSVAAVILFEAALSYLGVGMPPDVITWGRMVADGRETLGTAWWVSAMPGLAIALAVLGCNLFGDWLILATDPRRSRRGRG
jgi:peptide/nickel transport system permease protein